MKDYPVVIISSTAYDLPVYRKHVMDACLRVSMQPKMMEQLPAIDDDAIEVSLALVDEADVYIGLFAHRYGYVPDGYNKSITELEYEHAVKKNIPRLIFLQSDEADIRIKDIDKGESAIKLDILKDRLKKERVVAFFKNPEDLRGLTLHALSEIKKKLEKNTKGYSKSDKTSVSNFHYVSVIPEKGKPYIAHQYTLLQVKNLVGRKRELKMLTDWVTKPEYSDISFFNIVAIGGMGKSALSWTWFNSIDHQKIKWAGLIWWSFYESDATFENFITRTLAYVSGCSLKDLKNIAFTDQMNSLLNIFNQEPYLLVLDGLERILVAYASRDAAFILDDTALDEETANRVADANGLPQSAGKSFIDKHKLRKTTDIRAGQFLRKLAQIQNTRILASSRLYPADLQLPNGNPSRGCYALFLEGLNDQDTVELWRIYGTKGSHNAILSFSITFDKHPLLIQLLAYEVAEFREAPGNFDAWLSANPNFNHFDLPLIKVQSEVLAHVLRDLSPAENRTLHIIAGFRMPIGIDTLKALLIHAKKDEHSNMKSFNMWQDLGSLFWNLLGPNPAKKEVLEALAIIHSKEDDQNKKKPFKTLKDLDQSLTALEDRGLLGWDRKANRYDLHPIIRGILWNGLDDVSRKDISLTLFSYFKYMPMMKDYLKIDCLEDLTPAIELYNTFIELKLYDIASIFFKKHLSDATLYRLSATRLRIELLKCLFPDKLDTLPQLSGANNQVYILNTLAIDYQHIGQPRSAIKLYEVAEKVYRKKNNQVDLVVLCNKSIALRISGYIYRAEVAAKSAFAISLSLNDIFNKAVSLDLLGLTLALRGIHDIADISFQQSLQIWMDFMHKQGEGVTIASQAEQALWKNNPVAAKQLAERAWVLAGVNRGEVDLIKAARLQGTAALQKMDLNIADERLHHALLRARRVQLIQEEMPILVSLAHLHLLKRELSKVREWLDEFWELTQGRQYPIFQADALIVLAQIEHEESNTNAAIQAVTEAYCKAWCDGPPFAYHLGLQKSRKLFKAFGATEPELLPFDQSKYEPMPEIKINPDNEQIE